ncbi:MAG: hemolysin III family protein [Fimbriimonadaceae bacterium]
MPAREPFNAWSHLIAAVAVAIGVPAVAAQRADSAAAAAAFAVYGSMACLMFGASALYHWADDANPILRKFDHAAIYLMIAGTYTPLCLLALPDRIGRIVLALQWGMAAAGLVATFRLTKPPTWVRLTLYLLMGWMALPLVGLLTASISADGTIWVLAGGILYTVGAVVYASRRPNPRPGRFGFHEIWHLFVIGGALCHFVAMTYL